MHKLSAEPLNSNEQELWLNLLRIVLFNVCMKTHKHFYGF